MRSIAIDNYKADAVRDSWPCEANPGKQLEADDVISTSVSKDGSKQVAFDPSKATDAVINALYLKTTSDDKTIWCYRNGIYEPYGEEAIDFILDALAGNLYTIHQSKEVMKKVRARTLCKPTIFDQKLNLFGAQNGIVDLETGKFSEHSPDFLISLKSPVRYDPAAQCPEFIKFLWTSLGNIDDILTVIDCFVAMASMATWEYFLAMIGPGSNGKSVLESVITAFFGADQITEVELSELNSNQFIRAAIRRKRALINSEVQGTKMESRWIKMISGGTMIDSDLKNRDRIHFRPSCLQIFDTNSPPKFYDSSYGFQRRFIKLDFRYSFVDEPIDGHAWERKRDPSLLEKLTSPQELSGILNLVVLRAKDIIQSKTIHRRTIGTELVEEYDKQSHSLSSFFTECYIQDDAGWNEFTPFEIIRANYEIYCRAINAAPESDRGLALYMKDTLGCKPETQTITETFGVKTKKRGYRGLSYDEHTFLSIVNKNTKKGTDNSSLEQIRTDNRTDKAATGNTRTDKTQKYPVEILRQIYAHIENIGKTSVPSVHVFPDSGLSVPEVFPHLFHLSGDGRNLDEEFENDGWEDCEYCALPLPRSWQNERNGLIFCPDCVKIFDKRYPK